MPREPQVLGVIGNHQEIERPAQSSRNAGAGRHSRPQRESIRLLGAERATDHARIRRVTGMQVRITIKNLVRKVLAGVR